MDASKQLRADATDIALASELGLVNVTWRLAGHGRHSRLFRLVSTRAADLPTGVLPAVAMSFGFHAKESWLTFTSAGLAAVLGLLTGFLGVTAMGVALAALVASVIIHETGHVVVYRFAAPKDAWGTLVRGVAAGHFVRMPLAARADILVACGGAGAVAAVTVVMLPLTFVSPLIPLLWGTIAAGHALSLLFRAGDGATIRSAFLRLTREKPSGSS